MNINKKKSKAIVDFIMIAGLLDCLISTSVFEKSKEAVRNGANSSDIFHWGTPHCIISIVLVGIILIHILQHWDYIKAVFAQKLYFRNLIITLSLLVFIITVISFTLYLSGFTLFTLQFHSLIAHLLVVLVVIHLVTNFKKLLSLTKKSNIRPSVETVKPSNNKGQKAI